MGAPTEYYCDPTVNANGGDGSSGSPWTRTDGNVVDYALDNITRDSTNGDRLNVKSGTPHTAATGSFGYNSYGNPTEGSPLIIQGYTTTAGDGGVGTVLMDTQRLAASAKNNVHFIDMEFDTCRLQAGSYGHVLNCTIKNVSSSTALYLGNSAYVEGCYIQLSGSAKGIDMASGNGSDVQNCFIELADSTTGPGVDIRGFTNSISNTVIKIGTGSAVGIDVGTYTANVKNNSIYSNGGSGSGIELTNALCRADVIKNNLIEGFSASGGYGIKLFATSENYTVAGNAVYNCDTAYDTHNEWIMEGDNETLSESPFTDPANDDFTPVDTGNVLAPEYHATVNGNTFLAAKGAVAPASGSGGGTTVIVIDED